MSDGSSNRADSSYPGQPKRQAVNRVRPSPRTHLTSSSTRQPKRRRGATPIIPGGNPSLVWWVVVPSGPEMGVITPYLAIGAGGSFGYARRMDSRGTVTRQASKVIVIDSDDSVLLFRGGDPARPEAGTWWFPPGGGVEPGESIEEAARREVREETGLVVDDLGPVVHRTTVEFSFNGSVVRSDEHYFIVRTGRFNVSVTGWTKVENETIEEHRWWTLSELRATGETVYPDELVALLKAYSPR